MGGHPPKAQNKGTTRLKQVQRAKILKAKAHSPPTHPCRTMPVPFLISKMKAKLSSFIPESCFAGGTATGLGFGSLCAGLPAPTWEISAGFLEPSWSLQRKKTKVGKIPHAEWTTGEVLAILAWISTWDGHIGHGNPPAPKTLTCWPQASTEISTLLGSQTCCQQHLCFLKKRT